MSALVPCEACRRHIKADHERCPFCDARVPDGFAQRAVPPSRKRLDRLATFTFATTLAVAACGGVTDGQLDNDDGIAAPDGGNKNKGDDGGGGIVPSYGGGIPVPDSGILSDAGSTDAATKPDAAKRDAGTVDDDGGNVAMYGLPWPDGGWDTDAVAPPYGLPPLDAGKGD